MQSSKVVFQFFTLRATNRPRFLLKLRDISLHLGQATVTTSFDRHYIYHIAWALRIIKLTNPELHTDISSSLHFVSSASLLVPTHFYDFRPAKLVLSGLTTGKADLNKLPFVDASVNSLSCMHVVEHIGLGRYGDRIDYDGDLKAAKELQRVLAPHGQLLFVVPVGAKSRIRFNADRTYTREQVANMFTQLKLKEFALIPESEDDGGLVISPQNSLLDKQKYGCGCFWFIKE